MNRSIGSVRRSIARMACAGILVLTAASGQAQNLFYTGVETVGEILTNSKPAGGFSVAGFPQGLAFDKASDMYVGNSPDTDGAGGRQIIEVSSNGQQRVFATAGVDYPTGLAFNSAGALFVSDFKSNTICEFNIFTNSNGTLSSNLTVFASGLNHPAGLAFNSAGTLFEADSGSSNIYEFSANGTQSLFASGLNGPYGLAFNSAGILFEADDGSGNIYEFTTNGAQSLYLSGLTNPVAVAFNKAGILFVVDSAGANGFYGNIVEVAPNRTECMLIPGGLNGPAGIAFQGETLPVSAPPATSLSAQNLFVSDDTDEAVYEITPRGTITYIAAELDDNSALAFDKAGNLFVTDANIGVGIYLLPPGGILGAFMSGNCSAVAFDSAGDLYDADSSGVIYEFTNYNRRLTSNPTVFASGVESFGLAFDSRGDLFESDSSGPINEFTNNDGTLSSNLTVFASGLRDPRGLAFDGKGDLFEADYGSGSIYEFTNNNGTLSSNTNLFASGLGGVWGLAFNSAGDLFAGGFRNSDIYEYTNNGGTLSTNAGLFITYAGSPIGLAFEPVPAVQAGPGTGIFGNGFQLSVSMPSAYELSTIVQASANLVNWCDVYTNTPPFAFTDSMAAQSPARFYRAMLGP